MSRLYFAVFLHYMHFKKRKQCEKRHYGLYLLRQQKMLYATNCPLKRLTSVGTSRWLGEGNGDRRLLCWTRLLYWTRLCFLADRILKVSVINSEHPCLYQICQTYLQPLPFKRDLFKFRLFHIFNHLLLRATAAEINTRQLMMSYSARALVDC